MTGAALSTNEMLAVLGSRALKDGQTVFTGVGAPMLATALAQRRHAPRLTMVVEGGIVGPQWRPGSLPISTNEIRAAYRAQMLPAITDIFLMASAASSTWASSAAPRSTGSATSIPARSAATRGQRSGCRAAAAPTTSSPVQRGHHPHRARAAPLRRPGRLHHEPGIPAGRRFAPAERARVRGVSRLVTTLGIFDFEPGAGACGSSRSWPA
jgi:acyl CoA:acetate/3-ketoacid CoA transferase beta subunit